MEREMNYDEAFVRVVLRTQKYHLKTDDVFLCNAGLLHDDYFLDMHRVKNAFKKRFGTPKIKDVYGQCIAMSLKYHEVLLRYFGVNSCLTIGNVSLSDGRAFSMAEADYIEILKHTVGERRSVDLHVWLTLPSGRVFDPSIITAMSYNLTEESPELWSIIIERPDNLMDVKYTPMFVGVDYLKVAEISHLTGRKLLFRIVRNLSARFFV